MCVGVVVLSVVCLYETFEGLDNGVPMCGCFCFMVVMKGWVA